MFKHFTRLILSAILFTSQLAFPQGFGFDLESAGGKKVSIQVFDADGAPLAGSQIEWADDAVTVRIHCKLINGKSKDTTLTANQNPNQYLSRASLQTFWFTSSNDLVPLEVEIAVNGHNDLAIESVILTTSEFERFTAAGTVWIGRDHQPTHIFQLNRADYISK